MTETLCGSVHESPVRGQQTRATVRACLQENECRVVIYKKAI